MVALEEVIFSVGTLEMHHDVAEISVKELVNFIHTLHGFADLLTLELFILESHQSVEILFSSL